MIKLIANVEVNDHGQRLDVFLVSRFPEYSRSFFQNLIKSESVFVDMKPSKSNFRLKHGQQIEVSIPSASETKLIPQNLEIEIIYEDNDIAIINKPQGMVVHPSPGNKDNTLVNALLYKLSNLSGINGQLRPGIVHRLDKDTSGVMIIAKNDIAHQNIAKQLKDRKVKKIYHAIVHKQVKLLKGCIDAPIGRHPIVRKKMAVIKSQSAREAITTYSTLELFNGYSYLEVSIATGRTHQIRVHLSAIGHPILGDPLYGPTSNFFGLHAQTLHASNISFSHPITNEKMEFTAKKPQNFESILNQLRNDFLIY